VVVGGGNSAGQATVFLSNIASQVHLLVRGPRLADSMSRYLIRRIEECGTVTVCTCTEVAGLAGDTHLESMTWRDADSSSLESRPVRHLFSMTGAVPNTSWLQGCVALDSQGFVKTGADLTPDDLAEAKWPLGRSPYPFETNIRGVFAVGDARSTSVKRVASAVGEGSVAVQFVHRVLAE
jgi:thioredoxin reductase (NADPH)